jgi:hypothetical protein
MHYLNLGGPPSDGGARDFQKTKEKERNEKAVGIVEGRNVATDPKGWRFLIWLVVLLLR